MAADHSDRTRLPQDRSSARRRAWRLHPVATLGRRLRAGRRGVSLRQAVPTDRAEVLKRLVELPVSTWTYAWDHPSVRHLGPMSQDFAAAFGLGDRDDRIDLVDGQGVLIAAVQALHERVVALEAAVATRTSPAAASEGP